MVDPSRYESLGELLRDACVMFKTNTALIEASRKREASRLSYLELHRAALPIARRLQDVGATRVAIVMSNQSKWLITAMAAFYRGCVLVPLDYKLTAGEQAALLRHCQADVLVTEYGFWRRLASEEGLPAEVWVTEAPDGELGRATRWEPPLDPEVVGHEGPSAPVEVDFVPRARDDVATIVYSSGTGGTPKGCMLSHGAYLAQWEALARLYPMEPGDAYFSILPTNHAIDFLCGFVGPLCCGASVVHQRALRPELLLWTMQEYGITHMAVVPLLLEAFERAIDERLAERSPWERRLVDGLSQLNASLTERAPRHRVSSRLLKPIHDAFGGRLKLLFCGGAFVDRARAERFYRLGLPVVIGYGLTEACTVVTVNRIHPWRGDSVGLPVDGVEVRIVDADAHGVGEVQVRGPTVMRGYLDEPELTEAAFDGEWLKTGDLGWLDASFHLHLVGRSRNMIVTAGGKNVYPEDIEQHLDGVPVEELAVFAADFLWPRRSMVGEQLVAVLRPGDRPLPVAMSALAAKNRRLPDFKRLSGVVSWPDDFPRTASMKVKRNELADAVRARLSADAVMPLQEAR